MAQQVVLNDDTKDGEDLHPKDGIHRLYQQLEIEIQSRKQLFVVEIYTNRMDETSGKSVMYGTSTSDCT